MDDPNLNRRRMLRSLGLATLTAAAVPSVWGVKPGALRRVRPAAAVIGAIIVMMVVRMWR